jgi:putative peptidoglycan lipid II flippase
MEGSQDKAWALAGTFFWLTAGMLLIVAIGGSLFAERIINLTAPGLDPAKANLSAGMLTVLMFGVPMSGLGLLTRGIQNARNRFFWPAVATALGSVGNVLILVLLYRNLGALALAWGYLAGEFVVAAVTVVPVLRHGWKGHVPLSDPRVREMARLMAPFILFGVITRSTSIFERFFASDLPDGNLSYLGFSEKVAKIVMALLGTGIATANFPAMARAYTSHGEVGLVRQFNYGLRLTLAVALPALAIMSTVAVPLVTVLFERGAFDATATASVARIIPVVVLGAVVFQMVGNLLSRTFYVTKDTHTAPIVATVTTLFYIVIARVLADAGGYVGLAAAQPLYRGMAIAILLGILIWRLKILLSGSVLRDILLYGAASLVAFAGSRLAVTLLAAQPALLQLIAGCAVGGSLYMILLWLFDRGIAISVLDLLGILIVFNRVRKFRVTKYAQADSVRGADTS